MQQEILARGPIVCGIACPDDFTYHYHSSKHNGACKKWGLGQRLLLIVKWVEPVLSFGKCLELCGQLHAER